MSSILKGKTCFVFDAYGTLFSLDTSLTQLPGLSKDQKENLLATWRVKQLEYTWLRALMNKYCSFQQVTEDALSYALAKHEIAHTESIFEAFMQIYLLPTLTHGAAGLLNYLARCRHTTAILSNGTPSMLEAGVKKCEIGHDLSKILSVELVKDFKPSPRVYKLIKDLIEPDLEKVLFVSANPWDVSGASTYGLDSIWINPEGKIRDELPFGSMMELSDLDELFMALRDN